MRLRNLFTLAAGASAVLFADVISDTSRFRRFFTLAVGASAVLCAAAMIALVVSCFWQVRFGRLTEGHYANGGEDGRAFNGIIIGSGSLSMGSWSEWREWPTSPSAWRLPPRLSRPPVTITSRWCFDAERRTYASYSTGSPAWPDSVNSAMSMAMTAESVRFNSLPIWLVVALSAVAPIRWFVSRYIRSARRRPKGLCRQCGYDLRASPNRCPECGRAPVAKPQPIAPRPPAR